MLGTTAGAQTFPGQRHAGPFARLGLSVIDRDTGEELRQYEHRGQLYVAGRPGARYSIRLDNQVRQRLLTVVSVDGVNVITGKTSAVTDSGYVLEAGTAHEVNGWRKSDREIAAFEFASLKNSYAARTGRPDNVGVIGVAVFEEKVRAQPQADYRQLGAARMEKSHARAPSAAGMSAQDSLGTGHGERETSVVTKTTFDRASERPSQVLTIRYDRLENLVKAGVIPRPRGRQAGPDPFPGSVQPGYAADPPRRFDNR